MKTFYRCAYKFPSWKEGHSKWPDGFARWYWMENKGRVQQIVQSSIEQGAEAFIEEMTAT